MMWDMGACHWDTFVTHVYLELLSSIETCECMVENHDVKSPVLTDVIVAPWAPVLPLSHLKQALVYVIKNIYLMEAKDWPKVTDLDWQSIN